MIGYVLFVVFATYAVSLATAGGEVQGWVRPTSVGAAAIYVGLAVAATACLAPVLNRAGDPQDAARFLDLRMVLFGIAFLFFALWLLTIGTRALRTGALPRWLGWAAIAIAVLQFLGTPFGVYDPGFTGVPTFAGFLWVAVVSVLLALHSRRDAAATG